MSFDLAVWDGPPPTDDAAARVVFDRLVQALDEVAREAVPPTPNLDRFISDLERRWPKDAVDNPWALSPVRNLARGPFLLLQFSGAATPEAAEWVVAKADACGLVCFDPQFSRLYQ